MNRYSCLKFFSFVLSLSCYTLALSEPSSTIFICTDDSGREYYCTNPSPATMAKPATLPPIARENVQENIEELRIVGGTSCRNHGDVDCQLGADSDGSVICTDGYRDASTTFSSACTNTKIEVIFFGVTNPANKQLSLSELQSLEKHQVPQQRILITIRNSTSVAAKDVSVSFDSRQTRWISATGPGLIEPYSAADFYLSPFAIFGENPPRWDDLRYRIICSNCSTIIGRFK